MRMDRTTSSSLLSTSKDRNATAPAGRSFHLPTSLMVKIFLPMYNQKWLCCNLCPMTFEAVLALCTPAATCRFSTKKLKAVIPPSHSLLKAELKKKKKDIA